MTEATITRIFPETTPSIRAGSDAVARLLAFSDCELGRATSASDTSERFIHAHFAAIRAAAAVVAWRGQPKARTKARSVWQLLSLVAPELRWWAAQFEASARLRAELDAGHPERVTPARATELLACAEAFRDTVGVMLAEAEGDGVDPTASQPRLRLVS